MSDYIDVRGRGEGDVAHTIEIIPDRLLVDVDEDGWVLGVETVGEKCLSADDLLVIFLATQFDLEDD